MRDLLLFPCNGTAREALDCLGDTFRPVAFVDDSPDKIGTTVLGLPVRDRVALSAYPDAAVLAVPGSPTSFRGRAAAISSLGIDPRRFATVVHPRATVSGHARVGVNVLLMAGVVVTATAIVEDHVVVLPNSVIHHDAHVGAYTLVGSSVVVAGAVTVGRGCYVASGSRIRNDVSVAPGTLLGLGSVVVKPIESPDGIWAGTPARLMAQAGPVRVAPATHGSRLTEHRS